MTGITETDKDTRIDEILLEAQHELRRLREELGRSRVVFDSARLIVGHEFIKPLTAIKGYIELVEDELEAELPARHKRYFDQVLESVTRMEELIGAIINMLRIDSGTEQVSDLERVNVVQAVGKIVQCFGEDAARVTVQIDADMPPVVLSRLCLEVVLENLVSNALKHGGETNPVTVSAELRRDRRGGRRNEILIFAVEDRGPGIPKDRVEEIFLPFHRLDEEGKTPGLGLGLALVKSIVAIMKGEISVKSDPGQGTRVTFTVPVQSAALGLPEFVG